MHEPLGRASPVVSLSSDKVVVGCQLQCCSFEIIGTELLPQAGAPSWGTPVFGACHSCRHMLWLIYMSVKFGTAVGHPGDLYSVRVCLSVCPCKVTCRMVPAFLQLKKWAVLLWYPCCHHRSGTYLHCADRWVDDIACVTSTYFPL